MSGRGKTAGSGKARAKAKTRSSRAGLQFPVVSLIFIKKISSFIFQFQIGSYSSSSSTW
jgi:hypothetical protein